MRLIGLAVALALSLALGPLAPEAQQQVRRVDRIGFLGTFPFVGSPDGTAFQQGLRDHGYVEGQNLIIEARYSEGKAERLPALAAELARLGVSLIVASAPSPALAAKAATATVPIVFVNVADPIGTGLVASLAKPGGNITGLATIEWETFSAKQLEVIKEALPKLQRVAILLNPTNPMHPRMLPQTHDAAKQLGVALQLVEAREAGELDRAFETATRGHADAMWVVGDPLTYNQRGRIADLALKHRLPTMHFFRASVEAGGLLGFGPSFQHIWRNVGRYVDKILKGAKPGEIPVEQPTRYELVINLKTAKSLGLTIPPSLLLRADQVIE